MSFQPGADVYTQGFGSRPENIEVPHIDVRAPAATDVNYPVGKVWIYAANGSYRLLSLSSVAGVLSANWSLLGTVGGALNTLSDQSAITVTPVASNIQLSGTASQITSTAGSGVITFSLPSAIVTPGSLTTTSTLSVGTNATITGTLGVTGLTTLATLAQVGTAIINASGAATTTIGTGGTGAVNIGNATGNTAVTGSLTTTTTLTATLGAITATNGNLVLGSAGNKLLIHATTAASDSVGVSGVMSGTPGAVTVTTSACTTSSVILFSRKVTGGTPGQVSITTQSNGSFVLTSTANETSTFNYLIIN